VIERGGRDGDGTDDVRLGSAGRSGAVPEGVNSEGFAGALPRLGTGLFTRDDTGGRAIGNVVIGLWETGRAEAAGIMVGLANLGIIGFVVEDVLVARGWSTEDPFDCEDMW
jgi:hypothetical protein